MGTGRSRLPEEARELANESGLEVKDLKRMWKKWRHLDGVDENGDIEDPLLIGEAVIQLGLAHPIMRIKNELRGMPPEHGLEHIDDLVQPEAVKKDLAQTLLRLFDANDDKKINFKEVVVGMTALSKDNKEEVADLQFRIVDLNGDEVITRSEAEALIGSVTTGVKIKTMCEISGRLIKRGIPVDVVSNISDAFERLWQERVQEHGKVFSNLLFEMADENGDEKISREEYKKWAADERCASEYRKAMTEMLAPIEESFRDQLRGIIITHIDNA
eukprot:TRINITY_DN7526_c0_g1_i1.p2 TRINITY_DN7526_c0_g1~~TRINITY_DN7526_c0_g1_i1.p2  ORF type:complete len:273 (-),score=88.76 TRINITY_DN7526_c0_g1_i1:50-868(-)